MVDARCVPKVDGPAATDNWYPQRSDLRYGFIATVEVLEIESAKQIVSTTSNLSRYGCHVRTSTPLLPGSAVKLKITQNGTEFQSEGKVVYAIGGDGMGIHFGEVGIADRVLLKEWLVQVSNEELQERLRDTPKPRLTLSRQEKLILIGCVLGLAIAIATLLVWSGVW